LAAIAVAFIASAASAQTTNTICRNFYGTVQCSSNTTPGIPPFDWQAWQRTQAAQDQARAAQQQVEIQRQQLELQREQMQYQMQLQEQQLAMQREQLQQQQQAFQEAQERARRAEARVVPEGVLLNCEKPLGDGTKRCSFSNGVKRVIGLAEDCWTK
jgi:outer membrane protein TolC